MLSNAYFLAKIGADIAENEQHFAEILPKFCQPTRYPPTPPTQSHRSGDRSEGRCSSGKSRWHRSVLQTGAGCEVCIREAETSCWAANKRLETSKFKFKFPRARNLEIIGLVLGCIEASKQASTEPIFASK